MPLPWSTAPSRNCARPFPPKPVTGIVGETAAKAEVVSPSGQVPVAIATPHQTGLQCVRADNLRDVIQNRERIFALDRVLPLLRPEAG